MRCTTLGDSRTAFTTNRGACRSLRSLGFAAAPSWRAISSRQIVVFPAPGGPTSSRFRRTDEDGRGRNASAGANLEARPHRTLDGGADLRKRPSRVDHVRAHRPPGDTTELLAALADKVRTLVGPSLHRDVWIDEERDEDVRRRESSEVALLDGQQQTKE